jgi:hypothetical protein
MAIFNGVMMNVANQFHQICIFFAHNGFISILEKMSVPVVALVEINDIAGQQFSHARGQRPLLCFTEQVKMVWKQRPSIDVHGIPLSKFCQTGYEVVAVLLIYEYLSSFDTPAYNMMKHTRGIQSC